MQRNIIRIVGAMFALALLSWNLMACIGGCGQEAVPGANVGMVRNPDGFREDLLAPGNHTVWGRDRLYLLEVGDNEYNVHMKVLCADSLNFKFDVHVLASADGKHPDLIKETIKNVTPDRQINKYVFQVTADKLFKVYIKSVVDQESRKVVSRYETTQIASRRSQIIEEIRAAVHNATANSVMVVKRVTVNNLDFPGIVTRAQEQKAERQVQIQTEQAEQQKRLIAAQNQLKIEEVRYKKKLIEAAMVADFNEMVGKSITPEFLAWWQLKVFGEAAQGPNNWGFIPYADVANAKISAAKWASERGAVDAKVLERVQNAMKDASAASTVTPPPMATPIPMPSLPAKAAAPKTKDKAPKKAGK